MLAGVGPYTGMCTHVKCQAIGYAKGLAANLPTNKIKIATANETANEEVNIHIRSQIFHIDLLAKNCDAVEDVIILNTRTTKEVK